jgi:hypothetical protein
VIALVATALGAPLQLDRVDLLSEAPGTFLRDEAPRLGALPGPVAVQWLSQVSVVASAGPVDVSASFDAQTVSLVRRASIPVGSRGEVPLSGEVGVVARGLLPVGVRMGIGWRPNALRFGVSVVALTDATWRSPAWRHLTLVPSLGVGVGRDRRPRAPWM